MARRWILKFLLVWAVRAADDIWEQDLTDDMTIGPTTEGYSRVDLKCAAEHMEVTVHMEQDFAGVIYTRGSFDKKKLPCFRDLKSGKYFRLNIPFDGCHTKNESNVYKNVLVVQHDDDLIMPGDAAFNLECDFSKPKDIPLHSSVTTEIFDIVSKITLADADPGGKPIAENERLKVFNRSNVVTFQPRLLQRSKDEL
ncbi:Zona pellucida-like domain [Nesidiocoris tenuis]|uniref:Zona pellucida-like domain n=1 Tax=Nesidiocoris tenuis TaxID=355587 RepID=A0ABN7ASM4_9HEMI|nr:Zona pellucida-like domain [Nesidiocoris tenuis]